MTDDRRDESFDSEERQFDEFPERTGGEGGFTPVAERDASDRSSAERLWLVSYSDFMTIMMIFFLAMFGYSHIMANRQEALRRPLAYAEFEQIVADLKAKMGDHIRLVDDANRMTLELGEGILFQSGSAELDPAARATLGELAASIGRVEGAVIVEGHSDDVPIVSRRYKSNWELSAARAFAVVDELSRTGIPTTKLSAWGFGENRPLVPNEDDTSRRRNRRIAIVVLKNPTAVEMKAGGVKGES